MTASLHITRYLRGIGGSGQMACALAASLLLASCASVPNLGAGGEPLAPAQVAASQSLGGGAEAAWPAQGWWQVWGDPQLDALITEGLANSPDVAAAAARFAKAGGLAQQAGAARLPRLDAGAQVDLTRQSLNLGYPPQFRAFLPQGWNDAGQVTANLGFDLDLWGRNRAAYAAATSQARAAALDAQGARLTLASGIAAAYADLDRLYAERDLRARQLEVAEDSRRLLGQRQANGLENSGGVAVSTADVAVARIALSQADEALALRRNQIAALMGAGPDRGLAIARPKLAAAAPRPFPADAGTQLVARRADVLAARQRVEVAAQQIKVARADFFPNIKLSGLIGFQSLGLNMLLAKDSQFGTVGPAISLPIFHGGELKGRYTGARADYDEAVAGYNATVLAAYQQAADALTTSRMAMARLGDARAALAASQRAYDVQFARYKGGLSTWLEVLQVEDRLIQARLSAAGLEAIVRNADVALVRALGGGFAAPTDLDTQGNAHG